MLFDRKSPVNAVPGLAGWDNDKQQTDIATS